MRTFIATLVLLCALAAMVPVISQNTRPNLDRQVYMNAQHLDDVERRVIDLEIWRKTEVADMNLRDMRLTTLSVTLDQMSSKFNWIIGLLGALVVGFMGRVVWDVVGSQGIHPVYVRVSDKAEIIPSKPEN